MNGFFTRIRVAFSRFMLGRHGVDKMSIALIYLSLVLNLLALIPHLGFLTLLSMLALLYSIYRIFSKNNARRYAENAWYIQNIGGLPGKAKQSLARFKNRKQFLYFDCPNCHAKLRLPRGVGEVTVTCGKCGHALRKSA